MAQNENRSALLKIRKELADNQDKAAKDILIKIISRNAVVEDKLYEQALEDGVLVKGKLNPLLKTELMKFQTSTRAALVELGRITKSSGKVEDGDNSVLESIFDDE